MTKKTTINKIVSSKAFWIIISLLASFLLWTYIMSTEETTIEMTFSNVKVVYQGADDLRATRGLIVTGADADTVSVRLKGTRRVLGNLSSADLSAVIDVSGISQAREMQVSYSLQYPTNVDKSSITVLSKSPETISFSVVQEANKTLEVKGVFTGSVKDGYTAEPIQVDPSSITLYGPQEELDAVDSICVYVTRTDLDKSIAPTNCPYVLLDKDGNKLTPKEITGNYDTVSVSMPVLMNKDLPLTVSPFNEVDGLILAELSFINFEGIVPPPELGRGVPLRDAAGTYFARHNGQEIDMGVLVPGRIPDLMCRMAHSVRFGGMLLNGYCELMDDAREQQFAALTVELGDGSIYLSYRGTDDTIVGWKEDLNMGYLEVIPSQTRALEYLGRMTRQYPDAKLRIGGHSKGGNLSVYAAVKAPAAVQDRIVQVYNNDGPGFAKPLVGTPEHTRVADRILTVVPQSSVVGQLLEHEQNVEIVRSDAEGMLQHDGFSWQVVGDHFIHLDGFSREGKVIDETLESWEGSLSPKQREAFADALYTVLTASGAKTLSDLNGDKLKSAVTMLKTYSNLDRETRQLLSGSLRALVGSYAKNVADDVQKNDLEPLRRKLERQRKKAEKRGAKKK